MLIDATHPEETRVAVVSGNKLEEYDYENVLRKQLKSNIYLVKVTRVEPSLQAAFVDFGGNRHGFLPFPEIHPDYYRIPVADREALLAEERAIAAAQAAKEDEEDEAELARLGQDDDDEDDFDDAEEDDEDDEDDEDSYTPQHTGSIAAEIEQEILIDDEDEDDGEDENDAADSDAEADEAQAAAESAEPVETAEAAETANDAAAAEAEEVEKQNAEAGIDTLDNDDPVEETPVFRSSIKRRYKIQEVIKRNQIMLIQINKEERGNKGAAVTSYISLPGRYCVLMPNSPRGGGVSRKVSNAKDRQRLKKILQELNVPEGMSVILRTAGVSRSKAEIKRDLDYLLRLWDQIRELTLKSTAPALIYEEGNLIKRAIRDLYRREIDEVHVAGEEGYKTAKEFMRTLMPSHASRVHLYKDENIPLFFRYQVESQIDEIHTPTVHLKSGGYIVINPTEALVSIDVNSGRATKGRHIEETALKTNLEAAEEIARQLRLRDQGGLVVIDFIDMEDRRNNRLVERKMRDAMAGDRSRIQIGRISPFGLMELSRQRLHPSLVETNFETCKHCSGVGVVRTVETTAVMVLRAIEEEGLRGRASELRVSVPTEIALYIFNNKREMLSDIEKRYGIRIFIHADDKLIKPAYNIDVVRGSNQPRPQRQQLAPVKSVDMSDLDIDPADITDDSTVAEEDDGEEGDHGNGNRERGDRHNDRGDRNNRRRGRRGGRNRRRDRDQYRDDNNGNGSDEQEADAAYENDAAAPDSAGENPAHDNNPNGDRTGRRRRRRGRRGGRDRGNRPNREHGGEGGESRTAGEEGGRAAADDGNSDRGPAPQHDTPREQAPRPAVQQENNPPLAAAANGTGGGKPARKGWWKRLTE